MSIDAAETATIASEIDMLDLAMQFRDFAARIDTGVHAYAVPSLHAHEPVRDPEIHAHQHEQVPYKSSYLFSPGMNEAQVTANYIASVLGIAQYRLTRRAATPRARQSGPARTRSAGICRPAPAAPFANGNPRHHDGRPLKLHEKPKRTGTKYLGRRGTLGREDMRGASRGGEGDERMWVAK